MMQHTKAAAVTLTVGLLTFLCRPAQGTIVIDDFRVDGLVNQATPRLYQDHIGDADATRFMRLDDPINSTADSNQTAPGLLTFDYVDQYFAYPNFDMSYDDFYSVLNGTIDLTEGGVNDRFLIDVVTLIGPVRLAFFVTDQQVISYVGLSVSTPGIVDIPLASFGPTVDFTEVRNLHIDFLLSPDLDSRCQVASIAVGSGSPVVPEPASLAIWSFAALGIVGATWRRRRRRRDVLGTERP